MDPFSFAGGSASDRRRNIIQLLKRPEISSHWTFSCLSLAF